MCPRSKFFMVIMDALPLAYNSMFTLHTKQKVFVMFTLALSAAEKEVEPPKNACSSIERSCIYFLFKFNSVITEI